MKLRHMPQVDARYWTAITLASLFGTNLGDLYAHNSGLGLLGGLPPLAALAGAVFLIEHYDQRGRELYYWLAILVLRTGATNIADYGKKHVGWVPLGIGLLAALVVLAFWSARASADEAVRTRGMPRTGAPYWAAMLAAGVFGTFFGDMAAKLAGKGGASLALGALLAIMLLGSQRRRWRAPLVYWTIVAVARTAGTAMGDWLAENDALPIGLPMATAITGACFALVVALWPRRPSAWLGTEAPAAVVAMSREEG